MLNASVIVPLVLGGYIGIKEHKMAAILASGFRAEPP